MVSKGLIHPRAANQFRQLPPWLHRPIARCGAGWRGQHEGDRKITLGRLPAQRNGFRRAAIEQACGLLAGEGDGVRPVAQHLVAEGLDIDGRFEGLMVHARAELADIGEADPDF